MKADLGALRDLLGELGLSESGDAVEVTGADPIVTSPHRLGSATAIALAAQGAGIAAIRRMRFDFLNCGCSNEAFQDAVGKWSAEDLEAAAVQRGPIC